MAYLETVTKEMTFQLQQAEEKHIYGLKRSVSGAMLTALSIRKSKLIVFPSPVLSKLTFVSSCNSLGLLVTAWLVFIFYNLT